MKDRPRISPLAAGLMRAAGLDPNAPSELDEIEWEVEILLCRLDEATRREVLSIVSRLVDEVRTSRSGA